MGVYGLLELLKEFHISDNFSSLSQCLSQNYVGISQVFSGTKAPISNEGLCLEILAILKQVYNYHSNVKILFYNGKNIFYYYIYSFFELLISFIVFFFFRHLLQFQR